MFKKGIRKRLELLLAAFQKNSFDGVHINVVLINGAPQLVVFPTVEEVDPHEHRIQFLRQEGVRESCQELEAILAIVKPQVTFPKFILANGRDFYFDTGENPHGLRNTWATTKWTKDILTHAVDELLSAIPAAESLGEPVDRMIPNEYRSRPMPKNEAINFIGWPTHCTNERQALRWFSQSIKDGEFPCEQLNKKSYVFDVRHFPVKAQLEMRTQ